jgi:hypothetical protein
MVFHFGYQNDIIFPEGDASRKFIDRLCGVLSKNNRMFFILDIEKPAYYFSALFVKMCAQLRFEAGSPVDTGIPFHEPGNRLHNRLQGWRTGRIVKVDVGFFRAIQGGHQAVISNDLIPYRVEAPGLLRIDRHDFS